MIVKFFHQLRRVLNYIKSEYFSIVQYYLIRLNLSIHEGI